MTELHLIIQSIKHFWKSHLLLMLGIAISTMVMTGALLIGDSMRYSLDRMIDLRLGKVTHIVSANNRYFTDSLAIRLEKEIHTPCVPALILQGTAMSQGGQNRIPNVQVLGIDKNFSKLSPAKTPLAKINSNSAYISQNTALQLNVNIQDELLIHVQRPSLTLFTSPLHNDSETSIPLRIKIAGILSEEEWGHFQLRNTQVLPYNIFISLDFLHQKMETEAYVNYLLIAAKENLESAVLKKALQKNWEIKDLNLDIAKNQKRKTWEITSDRIFIDPSIENALEELPISKESVLTYFVNTIASQKDTVPYSFIGSVPDAEIDSGAIIINEWLAEQLDLKVEEHLKIDYFVFDQSRDLQEKSAEFKVKKIIPIAGKWADGTLIPAFSGWTEQSQCRDWKVGLPIDFKKIKTADENYWTKWKGLPKAYIGISTAQQLWQNSLGKSMLLRFPEQQVSLKRIEKSLKEEVDLFQLGFQVQAIKSLAKRAAKNSISFSQLFFGLSFFILLAGTILNILLISLSIEKRKSQIDTLSFLGISKKQIHRLLIGEIVVVAILGMLWGLLLAVFYTEAIYFALNSIWNDIVRTKTLVNIIRPQSLIIGFLISLLLSFLSIKISLFQLFQKQNQTSNAEKNKKTKWHKNLLPFLIFSSFGFAIAFLIQNHIKDSSQNVFLFFISGALMLIALLLSIYYFLQKGQKRNSTKSISLTKMTYQNLIIKPQRSFLIIALFAIGTFIIVSVGANQKNNFISASNKEGGTGGFILFAKSAIPIADNLNNPSIRFKKGLEKNYRVIALESHQGDDASCLNLHRISHPEILGVDPSEFENRFRFIQKTKHLDRPSPWQALEEDLGDQLIPAVADQTVIRWGLGLKVGDTLSYTNKKGAALKLKLVGSLSNSIFQGSVLIAAKHFDQHFPKNPGASRFLIDGLISEQSSIKKELERNLRDQGFIAQSSTERLALFQSIENTYLSIFLILGGLGLIIGTIGLAIVFARNLHARKEELAIMQALGFPNALLYRILLSEHLSLLIAGLGIGLFCAIIASLNLWIHSDFSGILWNIALIILGVFLNGIVCLVLILFFHFKAIPSGANKSTASLS